MEFILQLIFIPFSIRFWNSPVLMHIAVNFGFHHCMFFHCINTAQLAYVTISGHLGSFQIFAIMNDATVHYWGLQMSMCTSFSRVYTEEMLSHGTHFQFTKQCQMFFSTNYTNLLFLPRMDKYSFGAQPHEHTLSNFIATWECKVVYYCWVKLFLFEVLIYIH